MDELFLPVDGPVEVDVGGAERGVVGEGGVVFGRRHGVASERVTL